MILRQWIIQQLWIMSFLVLMVNVVIPFFHAPNDSSKYLSPHCNVRGKEGSIRLLNGWGLSEGMLCAKMLLWIWKSNVYGLSQSGNQMCITYQGCCLLECTDADSENVHSFLTSLCIRSDNATSLNVALCKKILSLEVNCKKSSENCILDYCVCGSASE